MGICSQLLKLIKDNPEESKRTFKEGGLTGGLPYGAYRAFTRGLAFANPDLNLWHMTRAQAKS